MTMEGPLPRVGARVAVSLALALGTLALFFPVVGYEFVSYDDWQFVRDNPDVHQGLSLESVKRAFTERFFLNWIPLTALSYRVDYALFGLDPGAFHATNLALHVAGSVLLFLALVRLTHALGPSAFAAAVFAIHPLHVEPVAWIASRKDALSGVFFAATLLAYARFADRRSLSRWLLVFGFTALGLLSKPTVVTLPFVLLLLDVWPLGRLAADTSARDREPAGSSARPSRLALEKLPLLALAAASSAVTVLVQRAGGALQTLDRIPFDERLANALVAYPRYLAKAFFPSGLAVFYPHPESSLPLWQPLAAAVLLLGISAFAVLGWRRRPHLFVGWFWFVGSLVPVIGLVQVGGQAIADRYTYLPLIGLAIAVAWGAVEGVGRALPRAALGAAGALVLAALGATAWLQVRHWRDDVSLFTHALAVTTDNQVAHTSLGHALLARDRVDEAATELEAALRIAPTYAFAHGLLGDARSRQGRLEEAVQSYQRALSLDPELPRTSVGLGNALLGLGRVDEAAEAYRVAVRQRPDLAAAHVNLGLALARLGRPAEAEASYRRGLALDPGQHDARAKLALLLAGQGDAQAAVRELDAALAVAPEQHTYHALRATLLLRLERSDEAIASYREALRLGARSAQVQSNLAFLLATHADPARRDPAEAVRLAEQAAAASGRRDADVLDTLSISYQAAGRSDESAAVAREALGRAEAAGQAETAARIRARLAEADPGPAPTSP